MASAFQEIWIAYASLLVLVFIGAYSLWMVQKDYKFQGKRSAQSAFILGTYYIFFDFLLLYFAFRSFWSLPIKFITSIMIGSLCFLVGVGLFFAGVTAFRSVKRVVGVKANRLVNAGIYKRSRNPQMIGLGLAALGVALIGRSGLGLLLVAIGWLLGHIQILGEERHLNNAFKEVYQTYCARVPRYFLPSVPTRHDDR